MGSGKAHMPSNALGTIKPSLTDEATPPELRRMQRNPSGISNSGQSMLLTSSRNGRRKRLSNGSGAGEQGDSGDGGGRQSRQGRRNGSESLQEQAAREGHDGPGDRSRPSWNLVRGTMERIVAHRRRL